MMKITFLTVFLAVFSLSIAAQEVFETIEVSYNLYAIENPRGGNIAFLVTRKGVLVVDAGSTPSNAEKIVTTIRSVTKKPIKYVILTHVHGDHTNGLAGFPKDVKIIAHKSLEKSYREFNQSNITNYKNKVLPNHLSNLKLKLDSIKIKESAKYQKLMEDYNSSVDYYQDVKRIEFRKPDITFDDFYFIKLAGERVVLEYVGPGHTRGNIVVKFSNHNVIHTGDLVFNGSFPYLVVEHGVDVYNWIRILDDLYKENIYNVIPGHGEIGRKITLKKQSDYFKDLSHKIEDLINDGFDLEEIKHKIKPDDFSLEGNESQLPVNIEVIYSELSNKGRDWWKF
jgi:glyoxylase-like metal-dependent hydrolase (beta-lactamase superfamily II)